VTLTENGMIETNRRVSNSKIIFFLKQKNIIFKNQKNHSYTSANPDILLLQQPAVKFTLYLGCKLQPKFQDPKNFFFQYALHFAIPRPLLNKPIGAEQKNTHNESSRPSLWRVWASFFFDS
jgi:hypothetical protein